MKSYLVVTVRSFSNDHTMHFDNVYPNVIAIRASTEVLNAVELEHEPAPGLDGHSSILHAGLHTIISVSARVGEREV